MSRDDRELPELEQYYMGIAIAVRRKANCHGQRVGAVIVKDNRIVSTGYNGTPEGMDNCLDGGCHRYANRGEQYPSGTAYDLCICVHAEQNALLSAARFGISLQDAVVYTTTQPCFGCMKEMLQVKIRQVYYVNSWKPRDGDRLTEKLAEYKKLANRFPGGVKHLPMDDPDRDWAVSPAPEEAQASIDEHGHQSI